MTEGWINEYLTLKKQSNQYSAFVICELNLFEGLIYGVVNTSISLIGVSTSSIIGVAAPLLSFIGSNSVVVLLSVSSVLLVASGSLLFEVGAGLDSMSGELT